MTLDARFTHVRLLVDDYAEAFTFYRDVLGFDHTFGDAESGYADFDTGDVTLALFDAREMAAAVEVPETEEQADDATRRRGRDQVAVVLRVDDVDETAADLEASGVDLAASPTDRPEWGIRTVHCRDPDGNLLEFNEPLE